MGLNGNGGGLGGECGFLLHCSKLLSEKLECILSSAKLESVLSRLNATVHISPVKHGLKGIHGAIPRAKGALHVKKKKKKRGGGRTAT